MGRRPRVSASSLPIALRAMLPSGMHKPWAESDSYQISRLTSIQRRRATYDRFILTTFLCTLQATTSTDDVYTSPAKLDTEPVANSYSGGIHTR
ncbi:hypothetical protein Pla52o_25080 [Novipirellula galeiformis]|uniref:Uncharacterized protein n=1 Tax=Novipirellula galeiformis TaxID=2528004 RepID=A0A5C6CFZ1_9BACT|nr:hypothetical protein Pla52o_25080 [Novipirellula galeiformis]